MPHLKLPDGGDKSGFVRRAIRGNGGVGWQISPGPPQSYK
jgi:hypothetical protein